MTYSRGTDIITSGTAVVSDGTEDADYPASFIMDNEPSVPAKLTTTSGGFARDTLATTRVDYVVVAHHNLIEGIEVRLKGNATNSWGSPTLNILITVPPVREDLFPRNIGINLKTLFPNVSDRSFRWWKLDVEGVNSAPVSIGEFVLVRETRTMPVLFDSTYFVARPAIVHETEFGVRRVYDLGTSLRGYKADIMVDDLKKAELESLFRSSLGVYSPILVIPDPVATEEPMLMRIKEPTWSFRRKSPDVNSSSIEFIEVNRGLYP